MDCIKEYYSELESLDKNLRKHKGRIYSFGFKTEKLERLGFIRAEVDKVYDNLDKEEEEESFIAQFNVLYENLLCKFENLSTKEISRSEGESKVVFSSEFSEDTNSANMARFDISVVGKNLQIFKGSFEALEDFVTQTELLHDMIRDEDREIFVKYVYNFKLTSQVRSVVGRANRPTTFASLRDLLSEAYPNPRTLQQVLTELGTLRQSNLSVSAFREKIALLCEQLSGFEIKAIPNATQEAKDAIFKMSESMALNVFMKGVNMEYQNLLIASGPRTLNEAVEKCLTMERNAQSSSNSVNTHTACTGYEGYSGGNP